MIRLFLFGQKVPTYIAEHINCVATFAAMLTVVFRYRGKIWVVPFIGIKPFCIHIDRAGPDPHVIPTDDAWVNTRFLLLNRIFL